MRSSQSTFTGNFHPHSKFLREELIIEKLGNQSEKKKEEEAYYSTLTLGTKVKVTILSPSLTPM